MTQTGAGADRGAAGLDLNLLAALDVLLEEQSVRGAARRLHLSEPAMSRTIGRIRKAVGDPVLVRAGRETVPTPYALSVRAEVGAVVERARALFAARGAQDLRSVPRTLTVHGHDSPAASLGTPLPASPPSRSPSTSPRPLSLAWHPRHEADPAHTWLRGAVRAAPRGPAGTTS